MGLDQMVASSMPASLSHVKLGRGGTQGNWTELESTNFSTVRIFTRVGRLLSLLHTTLPG